MRSTTFYRQFEPKIAERWCEALDNPAFEFAIKASQAFTHAAGAQPSGRKAPTSVETLHYTQKDLDETRSFWTCLRIAIV